MATTILGLPESEIDRLLREAESRLAENGGSEQGQVVVSSVNAVTAAATAPLQTPAGVPTEQQTEKKPDVSVRVPQLPQRKKVSVSRLTPSPRIFHDENYPNLYDAGYCPVMGSMLAPK